MSEISCNGYPETNKQTNKQTNKKLAGKGRVGNLTTTKNNYIWLIFLKYISEFIINEALPASNRVFWQNVTEIVL